MTQSACNNNSYDVSKIIKIQSVFRKYVQRKKYKELLFENYKIKIKELIISKINALNKPYQYKKTLLSDDTNDNIKKLEIAYHVHQKYMIEGEIAQIITGNFIGWEDLKQDHKSGLDIRKKDNSIIIELKNKYNTCNSSDEKKLLNKLCKYKKENPNTRCIWGVINPKNNKSVSKKIIHNGVEIEKIEGQKLLSLIFTIYNQDYTPEIIPFVKSIMYPVSQE